MSDIALTGYVTRPLLGESDLALHDGTYRLISANPGQRRWRRETATAPSVHGATQVSAAMDVQTAQLTVEVRGATRAALDTATQALIDAFTQRKYQLNVTMDGHAETWNCWAADISAAGDERP